MNNTGIIRQKKRFQMCDPQNNLIQIINSHDLDMF